MQELSSWTEPGFLSLGVPHSPPPPEIPPPVCGNPMKSLHSCLDPNRTAILSCALAPRLPRCGEHPPPPSRPHRNPRSLSP